MKAILKVNNYKLAEFFAARLNASISSKVKIQDEGNQSFILLVQEDDWEKCQEEILKIAAEMRQFEQNEKQINSEKWASNEIDTHIKVSSYHPHSQINIKNYITNYPVTCLIFAICIIVYFCLKISQDQVFALLSMNDFELSDPSTWYKLITPAIMNFSVAHIGFNLMWWCWLGGRIEKSIGHLPLIAIFILGSIIPNFAQYHIYGPNFGGLSGVNYALIAFSWTVVYLRPQIYSGIIMDKSIFIVTLLFACLGSVIPGIANAAHFGGLIIGVAIGLYDIFLIKRRKA